MEAFQENSSVLKFGPPLIFAGRKGTLFARHRCEAAVLFFESCTR
jgi:hypothetical protein